MKKTNNSQGDYMNELFNGKNLNELVELRTELDEAIKEARKEAKEEADREAKEKLANVKEGDLITVEFKGKETEVAFVKATEKRMVVGTEGRKVALPFRKFLG